MHAAKRKHRAHNGGHVLSGDEQLMQPGPFSSNINDMEKYSRTEASSKAKLERLGERAMGRKCSACVWKYCLMAIIRGAPIKNSKAPVYLSTWIFHSPQHLFHVYKVFYFTASIQLGFSPSAMPPLSRAFNLSLTDREPLKRSRKKVEFWTCSAQY